MIIHECEQGTPEWLDLRSGIPTASCFDKILTPKTGKPSQSAEPYMFSLLAERLMGHPIAEHFSFWMERGSQMESQAVAFYEFTRDEEAVPVGFITNDEGTIGASPDRLVGDDGLLEIKVPAPHTHISYLLREGCAYDAYKVQVQGQLWITGRKWTDVLSYHPEMPPALIRVERDDAYIETLAKITAAFSAALEARWLELVSRGLGAPTTEKREKTAVELLRESLCEINKGRGNRGTLGWSEQRSCLGLKLR